MKNTIIQYEEIFAIHPGYYIKELIDDMEITPEEFAKRLGIEYTLLNQLVNGEANISKDLAEKLSSMLGSSVTVWLNLQEEYDRSILEIKKAGTIFLK